MKDEPTEHCAELACQEGNTPKSRQANRHIFPRKAGAALAVFLLCGGVATTQEDQSASQLRQYIDQQVGGLQKLVVPDDAHLPQARLPVEL